MKFPRRQREGSPGNEFLWLYQGNSTASTATDILRRKEGESSMLSPPSREAVSTVQVQSKVTAGHHNGHRVLGDRCERSPHNTWHVNTHWFHGMGDTSAFLLIYCIGCLFLSPSCKKLAGSGWWIPLPSPMESWPAVLRHHAWSGVGGVLHLGCFIMKVFQFFP